MADDAPGVEAWKENTTAFDRVRSIATIVDRPRSASYIAGEACVAENTARDHLNRLVEMYVLLKTDDEGTTLYAPDPLHVRMKTLRDLLEDHDQDGLIQLKAGMQEQIEEWKQDFDVESSDELRKHAGETKTASETRNLLRTASDWDLSRYRLSIVEDAIENYEDYRRDYRGDA